MVLPDTVETVLFPVATLLFIIIFPLVLVLWFVYVLVAFIRYTALSEKRDKNMLRSFYKAIKYREPNEEWWKLPAPKTS